MTATTRTTPVAPLEVVLTKPADDDTTWHFVCHCTNDTLSACRLDVTDSAWGGHEDDVCPLCMLAWPDDAPTCPWGCDCAEDCGLPPEDQP